MASRQHYLSLKRKIVLVMVAAATAPLIILAAINIFEFQAAFVRESQTPFRSIVAKTKNSFELFLAERSSTVSLIASIYSYDELADPKKLRSVFLAMQREFTGFADLGLINEQGRLVNYVGPHYKELEGADYSSQDWFNKVLFKNRVISEVFSGFRRFPHVVIAVRHSTEDGQSWIVRATLDTSQFSRLIRAMNLQPGNDAFLINHDGVLQTDSAYYGKTLDSLPFHVPPSGPEPVVIPSTDNQGKSVLLSFAGIEGTNFVLMAVKPVDSFSSNWLMVRVDLVLIFAFSAFCIYFVAARTVGRLIERLRQSDEEREIAIMHMEHSQKLSSIGRLAAGIAHEVNNPLAIINEKAGLLGDLLEMEPDFPKKETFEKLIASITSAVQRCRDITHRMLGFARRMDVKIEMLSVNDMVKETLTFLGKEALHRNVHIIQELDPDLPNIPCDRGQLQQVFLNVLTNAFAAVDDNGETVIRSFNRDQNHIAVSFTDNGVGMNEETKKHIFEPFFSTKGEGGTGLGMAIIYGIIKRHGGDIEVESEPGKGTTITIILPKRQPMTGA